MQLIFHALSFCCVPNQLQTVVNIYNAMIHEVISVVQRLGVFLSFRGGIRRMLDERRTRRGGGLKQLAQASAAEIKHTKTPSVSRSVLQIQSSSGSATGCCRCSCCSWAMLGGETRENGMRRKKERGFVTDLSIPIVNYF